MRYVLKKLICKTDRALSANSCRESSSFANNQHPSIVNQDIQILRRLLSGDPLTLKHWLHRRCLVDDTWDEIPIFQVLRQRPYHDAHLEKSGKPTRQMTCKVL